MILIFDLMNTILDDPFYSNFFNKLSESQKKQWMNNTNPNAYILFEEGKILENEYFRITYKTDPKKLGLPSPQKIKKIMLKEIHFLKGIPELFKKLKQENFFLILASNYSIWYQEIFNQKKELFKWFDYYFFSCEMGLRKPDQKFFLIIQDCIKKYISDNLKVIYFDDTKKNLDVVKELNLNWECVWIYDKNLSSKIIADKIKKSARIF